MIILLPVTLYWSDNKTSYVTYFAVPMDANKTKTRIMIFARDDAGNETKIALCLVLLRKRNFAQTK